MTIFYYEVTVMKKILSLLLTLCLLALLCVPALANEECPHTQSFTNT